MRKTNHQPKQLRRLILCVGLALAACLSLSLSAPAQGTIAFTISPQTLSPVSDRLFGHLLERASWGEPGPEIAIEPGTQRLPTEVVSLMHRMSIPIIRFPGGTDVDYINWQDLISNVPNRDVGRPLTTGHTQQVITNDFGLDEYFSLRDELSAERTQSGKNKVETILVANFLDAASGKLPLADAAQNAAGLVAYANAPLNAPLPAGMTDWPAIRAKNGHPQPFAAEYLQIGNEWWTGRFLDAVRQGKSLSDPAEIAQWYITCLQAYISAIDAVDPNIAIIIDGKMGENIEQTVLADPTIRDRVQYVTYHDYAPGPIDQVIASGEPVNISELTPSDWWRAWAAMPGFYSAETGTSLAQGQEMELAKSLGYQVAITEWNWNGWGFDDIDLNDEIDWKLASAIGTAGYLHGLMRQGETIQLACQSLLVGANWDITSIRIDSDREDPPYFWPQGQMTAFYSRHHGSQLLDVKSSDLPRYQQPFKVGWARTPRGDIATLDVIATADEQALYIHAINRAQNRAIPIQLNLSNFTDLDASAMQYLFTAKQQNKGWLRSLWSQLFAKDKSPEAIAQINAQTQPLSNQQLTVALPEQSVSIFQIDKQRLRSPNS